MEDKLFSDREQDKRERAKQKRKPSKELSNQILDIFRGIIKFLVDDLSITRVEVGSHSKYNEIWSDIWNYYCDKKGKPRPIGLVDEKEFYQFFFEGQDKNKILDIIEVTFEFAEKRSIPPDELKKVTNKLNDHFRKAPFPYQYIKNKMVEVNFKDVQKEQKRDEEKKAGNQNMVYFSERERGRTLDVIEEGAWGGIQALIKSCVDDGSFGQTYPDICPDGGSQVIGTDENSFGQAVRAQIPAFVNLPWRGMSHDLPDTLDILDLIEFSWHKIGKPEKDRYHDFFDHYHLTFSTDDGREDFRKEVNGIFQRNRLAFELQEDGHIIAIQNDENRGRAGIDYIVTLDELKQFDINSLLKKPKVLTLAV